MAITTGIPNRRAELTASARQQANPQAAPVQQSMQPQQQAPKQSGGDGSFYGGVGGGMSTGGSSFYSGLGGGMNRPSQTRMAPPPVAAAPAPQPQAMASLPPQDTTTSVSGFQPNDPSQQYSVQGAYQNALMKWQADRAAAQAAGQNVMAVEFPDMQTWAISQGLMQPPQRDAVSSLPGAGAGEYGGQRPTIDPRYQTPEYAGGGRAPLPEIGPPQMGGGTPPPFSAPTQPQPMIGPPQRGQEGPPPAYEAPQQVRQNTTGQEHTQMLPPTGRQPQLPSDKGQAQRDPVRRPAPGPEYGQGSGQYSPVGIAGGVYDRPEMQAPPQAQRQADPRFASGRVADVDYGGGRSIGLNANIDPAMAARVQEARAIAERNQAQPGRAADVDYGASRTMDLRASDMNARQMQEYQALADRARANMAAMNSPRFAFGTDNSAQYQQNGMGNSWIPSTNNSYAQGKEIPPALQRLIDMGMPIPPALLNSVTGGQSGPLNMARAFTARGGGSLPSLQGMDRMSQDEREAFGGYLTGPIGMPEASTMDSIGRPTSNLQGAARSRMG